ncbi:hypothetical protein LZ30DRAFT_118549 [Colletotrichum cereale]|nr:hypothetical protein LZ30DRAFT_118549 [Colletotrichum cereale]
MILASRKGGSIRSPHSDCKRRLQLQSPCVSPAKSQARLGVGKAASGSAVVSRAGTGPHCHRYVTRCAFVGEGGIVTGRKEELPWSIGEDEEQRGGGHDSRVAPFVQRNTPSGTQLDLHLKQRQRQSGICISIPSKQTKQAEHQGFTCVAF